MLNPHNYLPDYVATWGCLICGHRRDDPIHTSTERVSMSNERLGDAPIEPRYERQMNALAQAIDQLFNGDTAMPRGRSIRSDERKVGFVLLVFPFGDYVEGRCNFISNGADRKDVVVLFKEMIARFEGQPDVEGRA
jgi:hypothetical protein